MKKLLIGMSACVVLLGACGSVANKSDPKPINNPNGEATYVSSYCDVYKNRIYIFDARSIAVVSQDPTCHY